MEEFSLNNSKVIIGFPDVTEIRIGSALRIAITYFLKLNEKYDNLVDIEELYYVLKDLKNVYKFKTVRNFIEYVLSVYTKREGNFSNMNLIDFTVLEQINRTFGYDAIPFRMSIYLNNIILPKLVSIALKNMQEEELYIYSITIKKEDYSNIYSPFFNSPTLIDCIHEFCKDFFCWLEYNQILRIRNVYVLANGDIKVPIKFSFIKK